MSEEIYEFQLHANCVLSYKKTIGAFASTVRVFIRLVVVCAQSFGSCKSRDAGQHAEPCADCAYSLGELSLGISFTEVRLESLCNVNFAQSYIDADAVNEGSYPKKNSEAHNDCGNKREILSVEVELNNADGSKKSCDTEHKTASGNGKHKDENNLIEARNIARTGKEAVPTHTGGEVFGNQFESVGVNFGIEVDVLSQIQKTLKSVRAVCNAVFADIVSGIVVVDARQEEHSDAHSHAQKSSVDMSFFVGIQNGVVLQFHGAYQRNHKRCKSEYRNKERSGFHLRFDARKRLKRKRCPASRFACNGCGVFGSEHVRIEVVDVRNVEKNGCDSRNKERNVHDIDKFLSEGLFVNVAFK